MNKNVIQNTYWSKAVLPKFELGNGNFEDGYNLIILFGLRLEVQVCSGEHCNNAGNDDFSHPLESNRIQNCYDIDDDSTENICLNCRSAGLAAGSLSVFTLVLVLAALGLNAARFVEGIDGSMIKYIGIGLHGGVMLLSFLAITIYGLQCYQNIVDYYEYRANDDFINQSDITYSLGPGYVLLLVAMVLQPVSMVLLFLVPEGDQGSEGGLAKQEASNTEKDAM